MKKKHSNRVLLIYLSIPNSYTIYSMANNINVDDVVEVKITELRPYGAFFSVNKASGLIHISELKDGYVYDISTIVRVGDTVKVKIISKEKNGFLRGSIRQVPEEEQEIIHDPNIELLNNERDFKVLKEHLPEWIDDELKEMNR